MSRATWGKYHRRRRLLQQDIGRRRVDDDSVDRASVTYQRLLLLCGVRTIPMLDVRQNIRFYVFLHVYIDNRKNEKTL